MPAGTDLTTKALLALEEVSHASRYIVPDRTHALRFALAYLYSLKGGDPAPFRTFWVELAGDNQLFRYQKAARALEEIYRRVGVAQEDRLTMAMWRVAQDKHGPRHEPAVAARRTSQAEPD